MGKSAERRAKSGAADTGEGDEAAAEAVVSETDRHTDGAQVLKAGDEFDLEAGIASIFATIRSGSSDLPQEQLPEDTGATYALLSRLNQLWQAPRQSEA